MNASTRAVGFPARIEVSASGSPYALARALSLDVAAGAVAGGILAAHVAVVDLPATWWPVLAASVWLAYTADHLLDARRRGAACRSMRHRLHRDHGRAIGIAWIAVAAAAVATSIATLPARVVVPGLVLVGAVVAHLALARAREATGVPKEVTAAAIYAAGIWFAPMALTARPLAPLAALAALHSTAAFLNLGSVAWFERGQDRDDRARSLALALGRRRLRRVLSATAVAGVALAAAGASIAFRSPPAIPAAFAVLGALQVVPVALIRAARRTRRGELYRTVGDLAFLGCLVATAWPAN